MHTVSKSAHIYASAIHVSMAFKHRIQSPLPLENESTPSNELQRVVRYTSQAASFISLRPEMAKPCPRRLIFSWGWRVEGKGSIAHPPGRHRISAAYFLLLPKLRENYLVSLEE
ncbi:hypothetical protein CDAR_543821 [Caerostris darwini]|uniref:Uncharacterized protein n=1 Tax=Caerostris darwini TaxID=1538125 RepID=A0AAV4VL69_9ARAC|nr:hypothetical protein CDAR_543821 [Caerostris darwini]